MSAFYRASVAEFLADDAKRILGVLASRSAETGFADLKQRQTKAWEIQLEVLQAALSRLVAATPSANSWGLLMEYPIPRRQKRIDVVLLAESVVLCLEFKTGEREVTREAIRQVEDYALDLRDFHEASRGRVIVPLVVAPKAAALPVSVESPTTDLVRPVQTANGDGLFSCLQECFTVEHLPNASVLELEAWDLSAYRPVPTIIEAAETLYAGHNVREIAHSHAGAINLTLTSDLLVEIIQRAQQHGEKVACFVTGVPGAGKTLAGLNVVHNPTLRQEGRPPAVFLSGNGPLVKIVSAAVARDFRRRTKQSDGERTTSTFIQNVHAFVRDALDKPDNPPAEHVVVFDEAQRAWNAPHNERKTGREESEPETMLSIMDRHRDWAVLVALVGGGQEIHNGEAGLGEWGQALKHRFPHWRAAVSPEALDGDASVAGHKLFADGDRGSVVVGQERALHLKVNLRSFRAQRLTEWVNAVVNGRATEAAAVAGQLCAEFPMALTRSLSSARAWLQERARGLRRCGLVASSGALRLRADGLELSSGFRQGNRDLYIHWFLDLPPDIRSSNQLEVAASEFECQGLELDWVGLCWGGDFSFNEVDSAWSFRNLSGRRWEQVAREINRAYLLNSYRVLLTRAREGMVIWIPEGSAADVTQPREWFDSTAAFLQRCGIPLV
jgi:hypothetical protein